MAENIRTTDKRGTSPSGQSSARAEADKASGSAKSLADQALAAGQDLKDKAKDLADTSTDALKGHASNLVDAAKDVASQATDKLKDAVGDRKSSGAEYVGSLADTIRRAAREFDTDLPIAGTYIRKAAAQVEGVSDTIRNGNLNDLVRNAQSFARRQPTAFLGIAVLAGFGVVRFLKSSAEGNSRSETSAPSLPRQQEITWDIAMTLETDRSIPELFGDAMSQLAKLVGNEFALARAELSEKAAQAGRAAALIGAGAILLIPAIVVLLFAAAAALIRSGFSDPVAYLCAGGGAAIVSGVLISLGLSRLSGDALKPSVTLEQVERDKSAAKEMVQ